MTPRLQDPAWQRDAMRSVGGRSLFRYLDRLGWREVATGAAREFVVVEGPADAAHQVKVPLDDSYADYMSALEVAIDRAADALDVDAVELLFRLRSEQHDILYVSAQVGSDDSLRATDALHLLNGTWQTVAAAAWAEDVGRPRTLYRGRRSERLIRFLSGLRLAHTSPGSFSFPVLSPLPEPDQDSDPAALDLVIESFERRALKKAVKAVDAAVDAAKVYRDTQSFTFDRRMFDGVSANLCRALSELPDEFAVRFRAEWSPLVPEQTAVSEVPAGLSDVFAEAADRLGPEDAEGPVTVVGHVRELRREQDEEAGEVGIRSLLPDSPGLFRLALSGPDYLAAVDAHGERRAVLIEGDLQRTASGAKRLEDVTFRVLGFEFPHGLEIPEPEPSVD